MYHLTRTQALKLLTGTFVFLLLQIQTACTQKSEVTPKPNTDIVRNPEQPGQSPTPPKPEPGNPSQPDPEPLPLPPQEPTPTPVPPSQKLFYTCMPSAKISDSLHIFDWDLSENRFLPSFNFSSDREHTKIRDHVLITNDQQETLWVVEQTADTDPKPLRLAKGILSKSSYKIDLKEVLPAQVLPYNPARDWMDRNEEPSKDLIYSKTSQNILWPKPAAKNFVLFNLKTEQTIQTVNLDPNNFWPVGFSADGNWVVFYGRASYQAPTELWVYNLTAQKKQKITLAADSSAYNPQIIEGSYLAYWESGSVAKKSRLQLLDLQTQKTWSFLTEEAHQNFLIAISDVVSHQIDFYSYRQWEILRWSFNTESQQWSGNAMISKAPKAIKDLYAHLPQGPKLNSWAYETHHQEIALSMGEYLGTYRFLVGKDSWLPLGTISNNYCLGIKTSHTEVIK